MKTRVFDGEKLDPVASQYFLTEAQLLMLINVFLEETACSCKVNSLRYVASARRNWEVASLEVQLSREEDANTRLTHIGYLVGRMTDGYQVAWPSTMLH